MGVGEFIGAVGGLIGSVAGVLAFRKAGEANRLSVDSNVIAIESRKESERANELARSANDISGESNRIANTAVDSAREANAISNDSNRISVEANEIARQAMALQERSDQLLHTANLVISPEFAGIADSYQGERFIKVFLRNQGPVAAFDIELRAHERGSDKWYADQNPRSIEPDKGAYFEVHLDQGFFRPNETGYIIDYVVTYKDRLTHHTKQFRVELSGAWNSSWSFKLLDICLDGERVTFPEAMGLAGGNAYVEGWGACR